MKRLVFLLTLLLLFISTTTSASAQSLPYLWQIESFDSNINIKQDGKVLLTETIFVDFNNLQKHGIYRDIPYIYKNEDGTKTYTEITTQTVKRDGKAERWEVSKSNSYVRIKIGDPDKTISGSHAYEITYIATGVLQAYEKYDEFYWNVTGNYWEVPINEARAAVTLPTDAIIQISCYEGAVGSTENCQSSNTKSQAEFAAQNPINPGGDFTIAVGFNKNTVPILKVKSFSEKLLSLQNIFIFFLTFLTLFTLIISKWWKDGRDFWFRRKDLYEKNAKEERRPLGAYETIVVEYSPPENLRPAELGTLIDQKADTRDVTATIIDLAARGYLKIEEVEKTWLFGKVDYKFIKKQKSTQELLPYEKKLYDELFDGRQQVNISSLKNTFYQELSKVKDLLYENVVDKKLFIKRPDRVRTIYIVIAIVLFVAAIAGKIVGIASEIAPLVAFAAAIIPNCILLILISNYMPRRTAHGRELYRRTRGYYLFIDKAEKHRQKFFENKNLFNEVLPYAITFGLVEKFAQAMKDIGLKPETPNWYAGAHAFNITSFGHSVETFSSTVSHSMAQAPRSSGSGGGGFSGGGGGGGGGGSW